MPLRDHFRPPLSERRPWEAVHGGWPMEIVRSLLPRLPADYVAEPRVHLGAAIEIDVATFLERDPDQPGGPIVPDEGDGGVTTAVAKAVYAPPLPTLSVETDLMVADDYEVRVYDVAHERRLVAAIELVSPANKDRPEHRRAFVAKCAALLQQKVAVTIVDLVTVRPTNLFRDLLALIGAPNPAAEASPLYAATCRMVERGPKHRLDAWESPLAIGQPLTTLPLWLADDLAIPLDLGASYEETCRVLRLP